MLGKETVLATRDKNQHNNNQAKLVADTEELKPSTSQLTNTQTVTPKTTNTSKKYTKQKFDKNKHEDNESAKIKMYKNVKSRKKKKNYWIIFVGQIRC